MYFETPLQRLEASAHAFDKPHLSSSSGSLIPDMATASGDAATTSTSTSAPDIHSERSLSATSISASQFYNPASYPSFLNAIPEASSSAPSSMESSATSTQVDLPDAQILEALRSKDRIYVLKLGEQMEALIKERRMRIDLTPSTSYQRLLVHRCSAYYKLLPETDPVTKTIFVYYRSESYIPVRRICELVPAEESTQPAFQIMRRVDRPSGGRQYSHPGSTAGDDADTSDVDASEAGSVGGVSSAASTYSRRFKTIEEREAEYNEARSRIFMGFEDKKDKEKDMSANSSTFSLVSGSGSTSGGRGSSIGDLDDSASTAPTESEWSGPVTWDKRDGRRGAGSTASSVRSLRSSAPSYANGSDSSRNSRATSPSFTYPTLYEPPSGPTYDQQPQYGGPQAHVPSPNGYTGPYVYHSYPSPPPAPQPHGQPYMPPYYYSSYPYPPPHPPQHTETATPGGPKTMYQSLPNAGQQPHFGPPYMWPTSPPPGQPSIPPHMQPHHLLQPNVPPGGSDGHPIVHPMPPPMHNIPQYPLYPPGYGYSVPGYFQQPYQPGTPMGSPPPPMPGPMYHPGPGLESIPPHPGNTNGVDDQNISRTSSRNSNTNHSIMSGKRSAPHPRGAWIYGPGVGAGPFPYNPSPSSMNDACGPRLSIPMRRTSGSAGARTPADETSSTASSSTTSSSSRRTFTSTSTSSKHPLPARPDWAVGLKPREHQYNGNSRSARMSGGPHQPQPSRQASDEFPPLSSGPLTRQPLVGGAWTHASTSRVMMPGPQGNPSSQGTVLVHYPTSQQSSPQAPSAPPPGSIMRLDEQDAFERPPPKSAELFNPKTAGRNGGRMENGRTRADSGASPGGLVDRMGSMVLISTEEDTMGDVSSASMSVGLSTDKIVGVAAGETVAAPS